jgi:predicted NBD/HSP70 family sugar kinase
VPAQVALYQGAHLLCHDTCRFDAAFAVRNLQGAGPVLAIDLGGDKIRSAIYDLGDSFLRPGPEHVLQAKGGAGYLAFLERLAAEAEARGLRVGISSATKMDGTRIARTTNLPVFFDEFAARYDADYARLFPGRVAVANDTVSGICGASTRLAQAGIGAGSIAFFICGSGLGAAVLARGIATHVEAAHVPLVDALNPLGQTTPCHVAGKDYVCLERVTAGRAGIEDLYRRRTGEDADGVALGRRYEAGDPLATVLYETSARALAHATAGVMERYRIGATGGEGVVVYHGGTFEIARYRAALVRDLERLPHAPVRVVFARDLSANVCLDGAAVLAASDPARLTLAPE